MRFLALFALVMMTVASCRPDADPDPDLLARRLGTAVDSLVSRVPAATVAVSVRDAGTGVRFDRNPDRLFHAASTMKVPVMIEVFRRVDDGRLSQDDTLLVQNSFRSIVDGSPFSVEDDSYDGLYERQGSYLEVRELVLYMITWSSNLATNLLIDRVSADSVQATSERLGTTHMQTLRGVEDLKAFDLGMNNRTTSTDLALLFEALRDGRAVSPAADRQMVAILTQQHFTEMIPAGLPEGTLVAHKTGSITAIRHDAGIVYPDGREPYVLVILIEGLEDEGESDALGAAITRAVHGILRP